jgi:hypothetical protein
MSENQKACYRCGELKILDDFPRHKGKKDGYASICKSCDRAACKKFREMAKKVKEEDPIQKLKDEFEQVKANLSYEDTDLAKKLETLAHLQTKIANFPMDTFFIPTTIFGEKSSMGDVIIMSRLPLFINQTLKKILMPQQLEISFNTDFSQVRVKLPQDIRFTRAQIDEFTQILVREASGASVKN